MFDLFTKFPAEASRHRKAMMPYIMDGKVKSLQLDAACAWFKKVRNDDFDIAAFEKECGVGSFVVFGLLGGAFFVLTFFATLLYRRIPHR